jgi:clathrin heavy chain
LYDSGYPHLTSLQDAIEYSAESGNKELTESLLAYFIENKNKECFAAMTYTCYDLLKPDAVMELAWRNGMMDFAMPYLINILREYTQKVCSFAALSLLDCSQVDTLSVAHAETKSEKEAAQPQASIAMPRLMLTGGFGGMPPAPGFGGF